MTNSELCENKQATAVSTAKMSDFDPAVIPAWLDLVNYLPHPLLAYVHELPMVVGTPPFALPFDTVDTPPPPPEPQGPAEMDIDEMDFEPESSVDTPPPSHNPALLPHLLWGEEEEEEFDPELQATVDAELADYDPEQHASVDADDAEFAEAFRRVASSVVSPVDVDPELQAAVDGEFEDYDPEEQAAIDADDDEWAEAFRRVRRRFV